MGQARDRGNPGLQTHIHHFDGFVGGDIKSMNSWPEFNETLCEKTEFQHFKLPTFNLPEAETAGRTPGVLTFTIHIPQ